MSDATQQPPLPEMGEYLVNLEQRCTVRGWFAAKLHVGVLRDIFADLSAWLSGIGRKAYDAEQADAEAEKILSAALADGRIDADEIPALRRALAHVRRSRECDRALSTELTPPVSIK